MGDDLAEALETLRDRVGTLEDHLRKLWETRDGGQQQDRTEPAEALIAMADRLDAAVKQRRPSKMSTILGTDSASVEDVMAEIESRLDALSRTPRGGAFARDALEVLRQHRRHGF